MKIWILTVNPNENWCAFRLVSVVYSTAFVVTLVYTLRILNIKHRVGAFIFHSTDFRWIDSLFTHSDSFTLKWIVQLVTIIIFNALFTIIVKIRKIKI